MFIPNIWILQIAFQNLVIISHFCEMLSKCFSGSSHSANFITFVCVLFPFSVAAHSNKNLMAASNLGVVFGPTLMKSREETMAAIMNLKYQSIVIELLVNEFNTVS